MARLKKSQVVFWDVDTQFDFMRETGKLYVRGAKDITPVLARITKFVKDNDIIYRATMDVHAKDDPEFKGHGGDFPPHCVVGTRGMKKIPETSSFLGPGFDPRVLGKKSYDIFSEPFMGKVVEHFKKEGITTVIVYGVATDYCVKAAALGFAKRGFHVVVLKDAIAGVKPATTAAAIAEMKVAGVRFHPFDAAVKMIRLTPVPSLADLSKHVDADSRRLMERDGLKLAIEKGKQWGVSLQLRKGGVKAALVDVLIYSEPTVERGFAMKRNPAIDAYVAYVLVEKKYRGKGYAGILLGAWVRYFDEHRMSSALEAFPLQSKEGTISLADLVAFYRSLGYRVKGKMKGKGSAMMYRPRERRAVPGPVVPASVPRRAVAAVPLGKTLALAARAGL